MCKESGTNFVISVTITDIIIRPVDFLLSKRVLERVD